LEIQIVLKHTPVWAQIVGYPLGALYPKPKEMGFTGFFYKSELWREQAGDCECVAHLPSHLRFDP